MIKNFHHDGMISDNELMYTSENILEYIVHKNVSKKKKKKTLFVDHHLLATSHDASAKYVNDILVGKVTISVSF